MCEHCLNSFGWDFICHLSKEAELSEDHLLKKNVMRVPERSTSGGYQVLTVPPKIHSCICFAPSFIYAPWESRKMIFFRPEIGWIFFKIIKALVSNVSIYTGYQLFVKNVCFLIENWKIGSNVWGLSKRSTQFSIFFLMLINDRYLFWVVS